MVPLGASPPYPRHLMVAMLPTNSLRLSASSTPDGLAGPIQVRNAALPFTNGPRKGGCRSLSKTLTTHLKNPTLFLSNQPTPWLSLGRDSGSSSIPLGLICFKMLFSQTFDPDPFSWNLPTQITWVHELNTPAQSPLSSTNTHTASSSVPQKMPKNVGVLF